MSIIMSIIDQMTTSLPLPPQLRRVYFLLSVTRMFLTGKKKMMYRLHKSVVVSEPPDNKQLFL